MSGTTETKQLEESPINDGNPVDDINETYAGRDSTGSDGDVEECDEELPINETTNADAGNLLADENSDRTFTDPDNTGFDEQYSDCSSSTETPTNDELEVEQSSECIDFATDNPQIAHPSSSQFQSGNKFPSDIANFSEPVSESDRFLLLKHGACQPKGVFKIDDKEFFVDTYYTYSYQQGSTTEIKMKRNWIAFSPSSKHLYCHHCWLFTGTSADWAHGFHPDTKNLQRKIIRHERNSDHIACTRAAQTWLNNSTIDAMNEKSFKEKTNFWREVTRRVINIVLTMAVLCIAFRGRVEKVGDGVCDGGNFLGLVMMQAQFDPFLREIIASPKRSVRYLSATIQNEIIKLLGNATRQSLKKKMTLSPFYAIIVDTTSDISRVDQLSVIIRWVDVNVMEVKESFMGFLHVTDGAADGLTTLVLNYFQELDLDVRKIRGQGYDGASVMSGAFGGVHVKVSEHLKSLGVTSPAPFVHCAAHNLNLVINDAVEASVDSITFFATISEIYTFFGQSLNRWAELALTESTVNKLKLKRLCTTRWSSRIDAVRAIKNRYSNIMKVLCKIILTGDKKQRDGAISIKVKMESFEFVLLLVVWERVLTSLNMASKQLQNVKTDLGASVTLLSMARSELQKLRDSWDSIVITAKELAVTWNVKTSFKDVRVRKVKSFFDELSTDSRLKNPEDRIRITVFNIILDVALKQLDGRFAGQSMVSSVFNFIQPSRLAKSSSEQLSSGVRKFLKLYSGDISEDVDLESELRQFTTYFKNDIREMATVTEILQKLQTTNLIPSFPGLTTICLLFITLPVTVASAERSFSKLKIIKNYLRSTMGQERLDELGMIAIENEEAKALNLDALIDTFAEKNARRRDRFNV